MSEIDTSPAALRAITLADLRRANEQRQALWCPDPSQQPDLAFRAMELGGEVGEALNVAKKLVREKNGWRGSRATASDLGEELADVVICADLMALSAGIDLADAVVAKFDATSAKVGLPVVLRPAGTEAATVKPGLTVGVAEVAASTQPSDFIAELQSFASMCERALSIEDGPMLAAKFRDAAFCISIAAKQGAEDRALIRTLRANLAGAEQERDALRDAVAHANHCQRMTRDEANKAQTERDAASAALAARFDAADGDWSHAAAEASRTILCLLGWAQSPSMEPGSDDRRDRIAKIIEAAMAPAIVRAEKAEAESSRLRLDLENAHAHADVLIEDGRNKAAEIVRLRAALKEAEDVFALVETPSFEDPRPDYAAAVRSLGDRIGYGALMTSASAAWRSYPAAMGGLGGEFVAGPCHSTVMATLRIIRAALAGQDKEAGDANA